MTRVRTFLTSVCAAIAAILLLALTLRFDQVDLHLPLNYLRDANTFLLRAKSIAEGHWVWFNPRVGMPFGADFRDFPMNITLDSTLMWVLSRFTSSAPLIVNLTWILAVALAAALAAYAFLRLGFSRAAGASFGVIFALLPYTYFRGTQHLHSVYYAIPLIALAAIDLVRGAWTDAKIPLCAWIGCLLAGIAYIYTAFFAVFILLAAGFIGCLRIRRWRPLVSGAALAATVVAITLVDLSPSLIYWTRNGQNASMLFKSPAEAELYALKIRYLITPSPDHPMPAFRAAESRLARTKYPLFVNENEWGRLGTIGSIGFLYLLVFALGAIVTPRFAGLPRAWLLAPCATLAIACMLLGTVGGFGDFISAFLSPEIRAYARIFPFIGFFSVASAAVILAPLLHRLPAAFRAPAWIAIVILAAYDQRVPSYADDHNQNVWRQDDDFVRYVETRLPANSAIFELPFTDFPNEILPASLQTNDLLRPYLHSAKYRWSWPAVSGTTSAEWNRFAASLAAPEMLRAIVERGFSGLWLDTAGYPSGASPESAITAALGASPYRSPDGRFLFYDLRAYPKTGGDAPVQIIFERGFYYEERGGGHVWHWSVRRGRITLVNPNNVARKLSLSMRIQTADPAPHILTAAWPGNAMRFRASEFQPLAIDLTPHQILSIDLRCHCPAVQPAGSPRLLFFSISDAAIIERIK